MTAGTARSVRNNNPCNIERGQAWRGLQPLEKMTLAQRQEARFAVFSEPKWGFRAAIKIIRNYDRLYGHNTVKRIISRWAPKNENNTDAYVRVVAKAVGVGPDAVIDVHDDPTMFRLIKAMATHETGGWDGCWEDQHVTDALALQ